MNVLKLAVAAALVCSFSLVAEAAKSKKKATGRNAYTSEQRAKYHAEAVKYCRSKFGVNFHRAEINYTYRRVTCWTY